MGECKRTVTESSIMFKVYILIFNGMLSFGECKRGSLTMGVELEV